MNATTTLVRTEDGALTVRDHSLVVVLMDGKGLSVIKVITVHAIKLYCLFKEYHLKYLTVPSTIYSVILKNEVCLKPL